MAKNELVGHRGDELKTYREMEHFHLCGETAQRPNIKDEVKHQAVKDEFKRPNIKAELLTLTAEGARSRKAKKPRKVGRPLKHDPETRAMVAKVLQEHGLTNGIAYLDLMENLKVSMTMAQSIAREYGVTFTRGRRAA